MCCSRLSVDKSWIGADIEGLLTSTTGCAATVVNDADAAGYAEMGFGSGSGENERGLVFVATFGTGIGTAMFVDGILVRGAYWLWKLGVCVQCALITLQGCGGDEYAFGHICMWLD